MLRENKLLALISCLLEIWGIILLSESEEILASLFYSLSVWPIQIYQNSLNFFIFHDF